MQLATVGRTTPNTMPCAGKYSLNEAIIEDAARSVLDTDSRKARLVRNRMSAGEPCSISKLHIQMRPIDRPPSLNCMQAVLARAGRDSGRRLPVDGHDLGAAQAVVRLSDQ